MTDLLALPWLLCPPSDFRMRVKTLRSTQRVKARELMNLAGFGLDPSQLGQLGKLVAENREALLAEGRLRPINLAIAATHTADLFVEALPATALRHGLLLKPQLVDYGQVAQQLLDPRSTLAAFAPDYVLLSLDAAGLGLSQPFFDRSEGEAAVQAALDYVASLRDGAKANVGGGIIVQTLAPPTEALFGSLDARIPGSVRWLIARFNQRLAEEFVEDGDILLDLAAISESVGLAQWHDPLRWHDAKLPFSLDAVPLYADHICRLLSAARGLSRKCLVLDLDNTLWGGIIGDDGLEGIKLGQGSARGEAHLAVQKFALDLRRRGIILAVCSKNEEAAALLPFREHDEMVLKEEHISCFVANWTDKATNLKAIAQALNIGTDSLVFLDDNPAERERVRQELPEVAVPEIGDEPADYVRILAIAGYFEAIAFGDEDRKRADMYQANSRRASLMQKVGNLDDYLVSLDMVCAIHPFDDLGRSRIAQLVNKSNQYNLTTKRYSEANIADIQSDPDKFGIQVRLVDRFGDNGMISVVIFDRATDTWHCDSWLMSCRVLGRRVEEAVLAYVVEAARAAGAVRLTGDWIPTAKNAMVEKHFEKLGFTFLGERPGGGAQWQLLLADYSKPVLPMTIETASRAHPSSPIQISQ